MGEPLPRLDRWPRDNRTDLSHLHLGPLDTAPNGSSIPEVYQVYVRVVWATKTSRYALDGGQRAVPPLSAYSKTKT